MNLVKTTMLLGLLTGFLMAVGGMIGGQQGMFLMLLVSAAMNLGTWFFADSLVIRATGARPVPPDELAWLHADVADIAQRAGIPKPRLYWTPDPSPNAFATGRSPAKGVVAVTQGLLQTLDRREVRGVIAHEIGHIKNRDTLISAVAATLAGAITYAATALMYTRNRDVHPAARLLLIVAAPVAAAIIRMAISRTREYAADRRAAELTGDPEALASALTNLSRGVGHRPMQAPAAQNVHMIVNGFSGTLARLMSTHPPTEERVKQLRALSRPA